jgi:hypothetical protein
MPDHTDPIRRQLGDRVNLGIGLVRDAESLIAWLRTAAASVPESVAVAVARDGRGDVLCVRAEDFPALVRSFVGANDGYRARLRRNLTTAPDPAPEPIDDDPF